MGSDEPLCSSDPVSNGALVPQLICGILVGFLCCVTNHHKAHQLKTIPIYYLPVSVGWEFGSASHKATVLVSAGTGIPYEAWGPFPTHVTELTSLQLYHFRQLALSQPAGHKISVFQTFLEGPPKMISLDEPKGSRLVTLITSAEPLLFCPVI